MAQIAEIKRPSDPAGVVKLLEELLVEAREGKIECLVTVTFAPRDRYFVRTSSIASKLYTIGALAQAQHDILHSESDG